MFHHPLDILLLLRSLKPHDHLGLAYETPEEWHIAADETNKAIAGGYSALYLTGEMTWLLKKQSGMAFIDEENLAIAEGIIKRRRQGINYWFT